MRAAIVLVGVLGFGLVLAIPSYVEAADWPQSMHDSAHTGDAADETLTPPLGLVAQVKLDDAVMTSTAVVGGLVYVVDQMGTAYCLDPKAGEHGNGTNKFLANVETWRGEAATPSPGSLNIYIYHPGQRSQWGDHFFPTGLVSPNTSLAFDFGPTFVKRPEVMPKLDRWYCYEIMVKANTPGTAGGPGKNDGRIAVWLDGKLVADFMHLRLRDVESLKIDRFGLCFHIKSNPKGISRKWYDNVVAATSYIGPVALLPEDSHPRPAGN